MRTTFSALYKQMSVRMRIEMIDMISLSRRTLQQRVAGLSIASYREFGIASDKLFNVEAVSQLRGCIHLG